jgi:hypothetical protein
MMEWHAHHEAQRSTIGAVSDSQLIVVRQGLFIFYERSVTRSSYVSYVA